MLTGDEYYLNIAVAVSKGAPCTRRQVGALLVVDGLIRATAFNTSRDPAKSCLKGDCPRGRHYKSSQLWPNQEDTEYDQYCACGTLWPCPKAATPYKSSYTYGDTRCIADHAEVRVTRYYFGCGATVYCTDAPCADCHKHLSDVGVAQVVTPSGLVIFSDNQR